MKEIAILGASGIGRYHVREFLLAGWQVPSILGSTSLTVEKTAQMLDSLYQIQIKTYTSIEELLKERKIKAVSVCTPPETHYSLVKRCLEAGLHVFCEKPLIDDLPIVTRTTELLNIASQNKKILSVNTQWATVLDLLPLEDKVVSIEINMQPGVLGRKMLLDHLPHTNSILYKLCGDGTAHNIQFAHKSEEEVIVLFDYKCSHGNVSVTYCLRFNDQRPREVSFVINDKKFSRVIGTNYSQKIVYEGGEINIGDPLKASISQFIRSVETNRPENYHSRSILANATLQESLLREYDKLI